MITSITTGNYVILNEDNTINDMLLTCHCSYSTVVYFMLYLHCTLNPRTNYTKTRMIAFISARSSKSQVFIYNVKRCDV